MGSSTTPSYTPQLSSKQEKPPRALRCLHSRNGSKRVRPRQRRQPVVLFRLRPCPPTEGSRWQSVVSFKSAVVSHHLVLPIPKQIVILSEAKDLHFQAMPLLSRVAPFQRRNSVERLAVE